MSGPVGGFVTLVVGGITGIASLAVHDKSWAWFVLAVAAPVAAVVAAPAGWWRVGFGAGWVGRSYRATDACKQAGGVYDTNRAVCTGVGAAGLTAAPPPIA